MKKTSPYPDTYGIGGRYDLPLPASPDLPLPASPNGEV